MFNSSRLLSSCSKRLFSSSAVVTHNPLGIPPSRRLPPEAFLPKRGGPPSKRNIPNVKYVILVASGKGGVGKSTVAVNLALSLAQLSSDGRRLRVGLLDMDVFGPSVPKMMGLEDLPQPHLTKDGAIIPLSNHGVKCMSMGLLLPPSPTGDDVAVVWRGLMVQKATQQLLFDVDWRGHEPTDPGLDILVLDLPPGTGDVQLTIGQLVNVDGALIVSTPQDVALIDAKKGVSMFRKVNVPIVGFLLNMSYFKCPSCSELHRLYGSPGHFVASANALSLPVLGELPIAPDVSQDCDAGIPTALRPPSSGQSAGAVELKTVMMAVAEKVLRYVDRSNPKA